MANVTTNERQNFSSLSITTENGEGQLQYALDLSRKSWNPRFKWSLSFNLHHCKQGWQLLFRWILENLSFPKIPSGWHTPNNGESSGNYKTHHWENLQLSEVTEILNNPLPMSKFSCQHRSSSGMIPLHSHGLFHRNDQSQTASTSVRDAVLQSIQQSHTWSLLQI